MQIASNISAEAHTRAMQTVKPKMMGMHLKQNSIISLVKMVVYHRL